MINHDNLEESADPLNYDHEDSSDTGVAFYRTLAQEAAGAVLEIACGTGRVSIPIAATVNGVQTTIGSRQLVGRLNRLLP